MPSSFVPNAPVGAFVSGFGGSSDFAGAAVVSGFVSGALVSPVGFAAAVGAESEPSFDISPLRLSPPFFAAGAAEPALPTGSVPPPPVIELQPKSSALMIASFTPDQ